MIIKYHLPLHVTQALKQCDMEVIWAYINRDCYKAKSVIHEACLEGYIDPLLQLLASKNYSYLPEPFSLVVGRYTSGKAFSDCLDLAVINNHELCAKAVLDHIQKKGMWHDAAAVVERTLSLTTFQDTKNKSIISDLGEFEKNNAAEYDILHNWQKRITNWHPNNLKHAAPLFKKSILHSLIALQPKTSDQCMFVLLKHANMNKLNALFKQKGIREKMHFQALYARYEQTILSENITNQGKTTSPKKM